VRIVVDELQVAREFTGVGRQVLAIGEQLADPPPSVSLELRCAADARPLLEAAFPPGTIVTTPIPSSRPRLRRIAAQQLLAPLRDGANTLVVCLGDQAPLWGRARRLVVVNDVRRLAQPETAGRLEGLYYRTLVPRAVARANELVTISEFSRQELERVLGREVRVVAHHPRPRVSMPARSPGDGHLLVVGALRRYKGVETVIEALARLDGSARPETLFVGPREGRERELAALAQARGVGDRIRILGWVSDGELERLYAGAIATVNPSRYEGYGLPVAESLGHGLPTIASSIAPQREIGADAVLWFPPGDADALAEHLRSLADAQLRRRLAEAALERARQLAQARPTWRDVILAAAAVPGHGPC
jgi:glycosyltransferase involved in cell wall biosynthesis